MIDKEYIDKLEELSFKFRDDNDLCNGKSQVVCRKCKLNTKIKLSDDLQTTYCNILASIYNASED